MNVLSLFSGVGGMDLGLERAGHTIVAMCEIDPHARSILKHHWPDVPIHEDVTTLNAKDFRGRIDLVAGGSPCQDLSVAGQRQGLDGQRSGLFWHQCRIADTTAARWVLWENVPGALSSNNGHDFAAVLWGLTGTLPRVPDGGWRTGGWWSDPNGGLFGGCLTLNTLEWPNDAVVCSLSQVLESHVDPKYCLSPRACSGVLRRAERRGRQLPPLLQQALERVAQTTTKDKQAI